MSIEKSYNIWAEQYDSNNNRTRDLDKKATIDTLSPYNFETVIELGCGTGKNTEFLLTKANKVIALDFSAEMLNKAKAKIKDSRVEFIQKDLTKEWEIKDKFSDLVTCSLVLEHIKDLNAVFEQVQKKLKSEGLFFISELHPFKQYAGSKARFEDSSGINVLETYTHHVSEYLNLAKNNGFELIELKECFDGKDKIDLPRLLVMLFKKTDY